MRVHDAAAFSPFFTLPLCAIDTYEIRYAAAYTPFAAAVIAATRHRLLPFSAPGADYCRAPPTLLRILPCISLMPLFTPFYC